MKPEKKKIIKLSSIMAVLLAVLIVVTSVMNHYSAYMDQFLGSGKQTVSQASEDLER